MQWTRYQTAYLADQAVQKAVVKSRRIGFSEVVAFESACRVLGVVILPGVPLRIEQPVSQLVISAGFAQAMDLVSRIMHHVDALLGSIGPMFPELPRIKSRAKGMVEFNRNKLCIRAFSTNPATIRSFEGDVILDEYGAMPRQDTIWAAAQPLSSATLANPRGFKIRVVGTPLGDSNRFWRISRGDLKDAFSVHAIGLRDAVVDGFPLRGDDGNPCSYEEFRAQFAGDEDTFSQEYECSFLSASSRYISEQLYNACTFEYLDTQGNEKPWSLVVPPNSKRAGAGMDVARTGHKSSIVELDKDPGGGMWTRSVRSERNMPWPAQEAWADEAIARCGTLAVDESGIGNQFAERLVQRHGVARVLPIQFSVKSKDMIFSGLRLAMEREKMHVRNCPHLRRAVLSLRRRYSAAGTSIYDLDETAAGHGDEAVALALATHAAGGAKADARRGDVAAVTTLPAEARAAGGGGGPFGRPTRGGPFG